MKQVLYIASILLLQVSTCMAQDNAQTKLWKLQSYQGELRLAGFYRSQLRTGPSVYENQRSKFLTGTAILRTKSYIWHPRFITLQLDGQYSPARRLENYLVVPDQAENSNLTKYDLRLNLFPESRFTLSSYYNHSNLIANRENLSSLRSRGYNLGTVLYARTGNLPFSIGYTGSKLDQHELETGRTFTNRQDNIEGRVNLVSNKASRHECVISRNHFERKDYSSDVISNWISNVNYNGILFLGRKEKNSINHMVSGVWQSGYEDFTRYQFMHNGIFAPFRDLQLTERYRFFNERRPIASLIQHGAGASISHQLYQSLHSQFTYDYTLSYQSLFTSRLHQSGIELNYTKKLFRHHLVEISDRYFISAQHWESKDEMIQVLNEPVTLKDGEITLLSRPYINPASVVVRDGSGITIYQLNVDYLLVTQNNYIQLVRIGGGLIPNNTTVYVNYTARQPGTFRYTSYNNVLNAGLWFFNRRIGGYARFAKQGYRNTENTDLITLNYFDQRLLGVRANFRFADAGVEHEVMNSTVLPYELLRFYANAQGILFKRVMVSVNGNLYAYRRLNDLKNIRFMDLTAAMSYDITRDIHFLTTCSFRRQEGQAFDLNLLNSRSELTFTLQKLRLGLVYNYFNRLQETERIRYNAFNVQLSRMFH